MTFLEFATCLVVLNIFIILLIIFHQMIKRKNNKDIKKIKDELIEIETILLNIKRNFDQFSKDINSDTYSLKRNVEDIENKLTTKYSENNYLRGNLNEKKR